MGKKVYLKNKVNDVEMELHVIQEALENIESYTEYNNKLCLIHGEVRFAQRRLQKVYVSLKKEKGD